MNGTTPRRRTSKPIKARKYLHFDAPLSEEDLASFCPDWRQVATHAFFPLLKYNKIRRRIDFTTFPFTLELKPREIRFSAHRDSAIFSVYSDKLGILYEEFLINNNLEHSVLAYRRGIGSNVSFAKGLFDEVKCRGACSIICMDISDFFGTIPHSIIKQNVQKLLEVDRLRDDWFQIIKRITKFEWVEIEDIKQKVGSILNGRICSIEIFRKKVRPLIKKNQYNFGIPQGTPISGLLANVAMMDFDLSVKKLADRNGGSYRRYSDDISIIIPDGVNPDEFSSLVIKIIEEMKMKINKEKTCITTFCGDGEILRFERDLLQYLGFTFDGQKILIRQKSIRNFYEKMRKSVRRQISSCAAKGVPPEHLHKRVLVGRFTHWGDARNFVQYAYRASKEMDAPEIKHQLRNHVKEFNKYWKKCISRYYGI